MNEVPDLLKNIDDSSSKLILQALRRAGDIIEKHQQNADYWTSDAGQAELLRKIDERSRRPSPNSLNIFDYSQESKAFLSSATAASDGEEWIEVEMCADTGACDTVMPRSLCPKIPIRPSLQSLNMMMYEVADGKEIPNLGERACLMWTDGATQERPINMQVADVHKPLLSLSRCADMGFESRFGRVAGALIDESTGDVIPLERKGNLYVLKCWLKAAPFGRQGAR